MPKKRRNNPHNTARANVECSTVGSIADYIMTPVQVKDSFQMETPVRSKSVQKLSDETSSNNGLQYNTPVSKRRKIHIHNGEDLSETLNITNLNRLFEDLENLQSAANGLNNTYNCLKRSLSIPGNITLKPLTVHKSTQTYYNDEETSKEIVMETPKISNRNKSNQKNHQQLSQININPYLKDKDVIQLALGTQKSMWHKQSVEEQPLFGCCEPNMHWSSTPIESSVLEDVKKNMQSSGILNNGTPDRNVLRDTIKEQIPNESIERHPVGTKGRLDVVNFNTPPRTDKVQNKILTHSNKLLRSRKLVSVSAKSNRLLNRSTTFNYVSNGDLNCRSLLNESMDRRSVSNQKRTCQTVLSKLKRYSRESVKRGLDTCAHLGQQIKNNLSCFSHANQHQPSPLENSSELHTSDGCKPELKNINKKIEQLHKKLDNSALEMQQILKNDLIDFRSDLALIKNELLSLKTIKTSITEATPTSVPLPPPLPPSLPVPVMARPPPPPPPPPPPMSMVCKPPPMLALGKKSKSTLGIINDKKDCRPVITIDDLRNVKLKKATVRQSSLSRVRASPKPSDIMAQVKLRRRTATPNLSASSTPSGSISSRSDSTSPASALKRLLGRDSAGRVKRLRNVGRSSDPLFRQAQRSPGRFLSRERSIS